jgi:hypothetical protein
MIFIYCSYGYFFYITVDFSEISFLFFLFLITNDNTGFSHMLKLINLVPFKTLKTIFIFSYYYSITSTLRFFIFSTLLLPTLAFVSSINIRIYIYIDDDLYLFLLLLRCYIVIRGILNFSQFFLTISTYSRYHDNNDITVCSVVYSRYT